jgi:ubiquinone/menaquinone biosynthesis C-methylase UbiE
VFQLEPGHDDAVTPWYSLVREYLGDVAGLSVLEVACGRGGFVDFLKRAGARVRGCDFSMGALRAARKKTAFEKTERGSWLVQGDVQRLPFADNSFDRVIDCETIEHVPDDQSALREMFRVAKPGGGLLLTTPNYARQENPRVPEMTSRGPNSQYPTAARAQAAVMSRFRGRFG